MLFDRSVALPVSINADFDDHDWIFKNAIESTVAPKASSKTVAVSGSHGMIGAGVVSLLRFLGHPVIRLERSSSKSRVSSIDGSDVHHSESSIISSTVWEPHRGLVCPHDLNGIDAVIHLAGAGIADRRWSPQRKDELKRSRIEATKTLAMQLSFLPQPPKVFVSASGVGIYGNRFADELDETEPANSDFLGQLALHWERASKVLEERGVRVCIGRLGMVLTPKDGALASMLPLFRWGLGGQLGNGKQYWSWIGYQDAVSAFVWLALNPRCLGPFNLVAGSLMNRDFTRILAKTLRRPAYLPVPSSLLRITMGEMADALLLNSTRAVGKRLLETGFPIRHHELGNALRAMLGVQGEQDSAILID